MLADYSVLSFLLYALAWAAVMWTLYAVATRFRLQRYFLLLKHYVHFLYLPLVRLNGLLAHVRWRRNHRWYVSEISRCEGPFLVTVHGTFAGSPEVIGAQWWQRGSAFTERLAAVGTGGSLSLVTLPFHWSGENSDRARLLASTRLKHLMLELESRDREFSLVAHSHGGNVALTAVDFLLREGITPHHLVSVATLGTPFLEMRLRNTTRVARFFRGLLATALLFFFALTTVISVIRAASGVALLSDIAWVLAFYSLYFLASKFLPDAVDNRILGRDLWDHLNLQARTTIFRYRRDEAIDALQLISRSKGTLVSVRSARRLLAAKSRAASAYFALLLTVLFGIGFYRFHIIGNNLPLTNLVNAAHYSLTVAVVFFTLWFLMGIVGGQLLALLCCYPASRLANSMLVNSVRDVVFGCDGNREVAEVGAIPGKLTATTIELENPIVEVGAFGRSVEALVKSYYLDMFHGQGFAQLRESARRFLDEVLQSIAHCSYFHDERILASLAESVHKRRLPEGAVCTVRAPHGEAPGNGWD